MMALGSSRVRSGGVLLAAYALFIPSAYRPDTTWPVLFALDPRGRAPVPLARVREAAERLGWVVLSSYNTMSDGPAEPNVRALTAMLSEVERWIAVDERRLYLLGFSGTARMSWSLAYQLGDHVAGVIGFGAGLPSPHLLPMHARQGGTSFAFFGAVGDEDFTYEEVWALDGRLDDYRVAHRVEYFRGPHAWPPREIVARALGWMEIQAIKAARRADDPALRDSLYRQWAEDARALERAGLHLEAYRALEALARDFQGLRDVSEAQRGALALGRSAAVRAAVRAMGGAVERSIAYQNRIGAFVEDFRAAEAPPGVEQALQRLQVHELRRLAADREDSLGARSAQRLLANAFATVCFYEPRIQLERGDAGRALALLTIAEALRPGFPGTCYGRAQALAQLNRVSESVAALRCALEAGSSPRTGRRRTGISRRSVATRATARSCGESRTD
jgi:predicted esterase